MRPFTEIQQFFDQLDPGRTSGETQLSSSLHHSAGLDIQDFRTHTADDGLRHINRKQTAKTGKLMVNTYVPHYHMSVEILCDINPNRKGSIDQISHVDRVCHSLEQIAHHLHRYNMTHVQFRFPSSHKKELISYSSTRLSKDLSQIQNQLRQYVSGLKSKKYTSLLIPFVKRMSTVTKKRVIILISDMLDIQTDSHLLQDLYSRHNVLVLRLALDPLSGRNYEWGGVK